jgi:hypothetical protein
MRNGLFIAHLVPRAVHTWHFSDQLGGTPYRQLLDPKRTIAGPFLEGLEQPGEATLDGVVGDAVAELA